MLVTAAGRAPRPDRARTAAASPARQENVDLFCASWPAQPAPEASRDRSVDQV